MSQKFICDIDNHGCLSGSVDLDLNLDYHGTLKGFLISHLDFTQQFSMGVILFPKVNRVL